MCLAARSRLRPFRSGSLTTRWHVLCSTTHLLLLGEGEEMSKRKYKLSAFLIALFAATCNAESEFHVIKGIPGGELYVRQEDVYRDGADRDWKEWAGSILSAPLPYRVHSCGREKRGRCNYPSPHGYRRGGKIGFARCLHRRWHNLMARTSSGRRKTIGSRTCSSWQVPTGEFARCHESTSSSMGRCHCRRVKLLLRCGRIMTCRRSCSLDEWRQRN